MQSRQLLPHASVQALQQTKWRPFCYLIVTVTAEDNLIGLWRKTNVPRRSGNLPERAQKRQPAEFDLDHCKTLASPKIARVPNGPDTSGFNVKTNNLSLFEVNAFGSDTARCHLSHPWSAPGSEYTLGCSTAGRHRPKQSFLCQL